MEGKQTIHIISYRYRRSYINDLFFHDNVMQTIHPLLIFCLACLSVWFFIYGVFTIHSLVLAKLQFTPLYPVVVVYEQSRTYHINRFMIHRESSTHEPLSTILDRDTANSPLSTASVNEIPLATSTVVIRTPKSTPVVMSQTQSPVSSQIAYTEPYWNQSSFYMNLGQFYEHHQKFRHYQS